MLKGKRMKRLCALPLPPQVAGARVTLFGRGCVQAEGKCTVLELSAGRIRLRMEDGVLCVLGEALQMKELGMDAAMITGERIDTATYVHAQREGSACM